MTGLLFEPPPQVGHPDSDGNVVLTKAEWDLIISWMERLTQHMSDNYD